MVFSTATMVMLTQHSVTLDLHYLSCFIMIPAGFKIWFVELRLLVYIPSYVVIGIHVIELFPQIINRNKCSNTHDIHATYIYNHIKSEI